MPDLTAINTKRAKKTRGAAASAAFEVHLEGGEEAVAGVAKAGNNIGALMRCESSEAA